MDFLNACWLSYINLVLNWVRVIENLIYNFVPKCQGLIKSVRTGTCFYFHITMININTFIHIINSASGSVPVHLTRETSMQMIINDKAEIGRLGQNFIVCVPMQLTEKNSLTCLTGWSRLSFTGTLTKPPKHVRKILSPCHNNIMLI